MALWLRSALFNVAFYAWLALLAIPALPLLALPRRLLIRPTRLWAWGVIRLLRLIVGIRVAVIGRAAVPAGPILIAAKHQSPWDTIIFLLLFDDPAYVMKRELRRLPLYGWFSAKMRMIAVDRSAGAKALKEMVDAAKAAVADGRAIVIFPQGTRVPPGRHARYQPGVYALARELSLPTVPVALNSGRFWGAKDFLKRPGVITLEFLEPLPPTLERAAYMAALESAIETATTKIDSAS